MKKQYLFGYFFVRAAKPLALLVIIIGIGFCVLQYSEAHTAASAAAYQPSASLQRALVNLRDCFSATEQIISAVNTDNQIPTPKVQVPRFPKVIASNADFARVGEMLSTIDQKRQQLKQSVVGRFEDAVKSIETKLRAYAATLHSLPSPTPAAAPSPVSNVSPLPVSAEQESLFSSKLSGDEVNKRSASLNLRKEFLKVLGGKAENPANRAKLSEAVGQLDSLSKLLPEKVESPAEGEGEPAPEPSAESREEPGRKVFPSERMALELEQLRGEVRQILLTSWSIDEIFEQAADLTSVERDKCRVAALAQKSIWLSAISRMLPGLLAAILVSFLIVVSADLVKTLLDTAAHTGVLADAIDALRGSIVTSRQQPPEP